MFNNYLIMTSVVKRAAREIGDSLYVSIPADWVKSHRIVKGGNLTFIIGDAIVILPPRDLSSHEIDSMYHQLAVVTKAVLAPESIK